MISPQRQRLITFGIVAVAFGALALAVAYQEDDRLGDARTVGLNDDAAVTAGTDSTLALPAGAAGGAAPIVADDIIQDFLPRGGEASACSEPVGVDLAPGYGATLTINGREIAPEEMNVNLDANGEITNVITSSRSLGQFTFQPDDNCPTGTFLRPLANVLEVCVYRFDDPSQRCTITTEYVFDAL